MTRPRACGRSCGRPTRTRTGTPSGTRSRPGTGIRGQPNWPGRPEALAQPPRFAAALGQHSFKTLDRILVSPWGPRPVGAVVSAAGYAVVLDRRTIQQEQSRAALIAALQSRPGDLSLLMSLGGYYRGSKDLREKAQQVRWYQAAVAANPRSVSAHMRLAYALGTVWDWDNAIVHYEEAIRHSPRNSGVLVSAYISLGATHVAKHDPDRAIIALEEALPARPETTRRAPRPRD